MICQDFARYQLKVGENIGVGDKDFMGEKDQVEVASEKGLAADFIRHMPAQYDTQLGTWFRDGKELSGGQWQKIALSRAFMRSRAEVLILDEPTAAIDAKAEAEIFAHFRELTGNRISIIISHRWIRAKSWRKVIMPTCWRWVVNTRLCLNCRPRGTNKRVIKI